MHRISHARSSLKHPAAPGIPKIAAPWSVDLAAKSTVEEGAASPASGKIDVEDALMHDESTSLPPAPRHIELVSVAVATHTRRLMPRPSSVDSGHQQHHQQNHLTPQLVPSIPAVWGLHGLPFEAAAAASGRHRPHRRGQL